MTSRALLARPLQCAPFMQWAQRHRLVEQILGSVWFAPVGAFLIGVGLAVAALRVDRTRGWVILDFSASGAQAFLSGVSAALISFLGLVFAVITLAIQFAAGNLSPRLLKPLLSGRSARLLLGLAMLTLGYSLTVLLRVDDAFVPQLAIAGSLPLMALSVFGFVGLIDVASRGLRFASVISRILADGLAAVTRAFPDPYTPGCEDEAARVAPGARAPRIVAYRGEAGVIQDLDRAGLVAAAARAGGLIVLLRGVGDHVYAGVPLFRVAEATAAVPDAVLHGSVLVGRERRVAGDPAYAIRLLVDVAERALSPAVNDPTTAVGCLDRLECLLHALGHRRLATGELADAAGGVRVRIPTPGWPDYVALACDEIRAFGIESVQVTRRLRAMLEDLIAALPEGRLRPLAQQLAILDRELELHLLVPAERARAAVADRQGLGGATDGALDAARAAPFSDAGARPRPRG